MKHCPSCFDWRYRKEAVINIWGRCWVCRECALEKHAHVGRAKVAIYDLAGDFSPANLKRLADACIMDANAIFLPAGKLTMAETLERERVLASPTHRRMRRMIDGLR